MSNYYTKNQIDSKDGILVRKFDGYYDKNEVDDKFSKMPIVNLTNYYDKAAID